MTRLARDFRAHWNDPTRWAIGVWLGLSVTLFAYVVRHGRDTPMWEEWYDLDALYGVTSPLDWIFGRLNQHRYVLGRAILYGLFHATGGDFRAGLCVSVTLLSASAAILLRTLRQLRGRWHGIDVAVPLLLMNPGASENLLLGYQMHFTIDVLLIALFVRCVACADLWPPHVTAWRVGVLTGLLSLGGWVGLAFVPGATAWVALLAVRGRRRDALALTVPLLACGLFAWSYADVRRHPIVGQLDNGAGETLRVAAEFFALALGNLGVWWTPAAGVVVGVGVAALVAVLVRGLARSPGRRVVAVGALAAVLALAMMAYGTGRHRANGNAVRNIPLLAFLPILGLVHAVKFATPPGRRLGRIVTLATVSLAASIHAVGWVEAERAASFSRTKFDLFAEDRDGGLPLRFLVSRHQMFPCSEVFTGTRLLRSRGHPFARDIPDAPPLLRRAARRADPDAVGRPRRPGRGVGRRHAAGLAVRRPRAGPRPRRPGDVALPAGLRARGDPTGVAQARRLDRVERLHAVADAQRLDARLLGQRRRGRILATPAPRSGRFRGAVGRAAGAGGLTQASSPKPRRRGR